MSDTVPPCTAQIFSHIPIAVYSRVWVRQVHPFLGTTRPQRADADRRTAPRVMAHASLNPVNEARAMESQPPAASSASAPESTTVIEAETDDSSLFPAVMELRLRLRQNLVRLKLLAQTQNLWGRPQPGPAHSAGG